MTRHVYFRTGTRLVRMALDEDFDETPLYADLIDAQTGRIERDNRLIQQVLGGEFCEPLSTAEIDSFTKSPAS